MISIQSPRTLESIVFLLSKVTSVDFGYHVYVLLLSYSQIDFERFIPEALRTHLIIYYIAIVLRNLWVQYTREEYNKN